jgi:tyrosine decarboxylase/aspartate 1-decarboxylase
MEEKGKSVDEILKRLSKARGSDWKYSDGRILGSMCTSPHPFAKTVYEQFLDTNLGDAGLFPGTKELEKEAVSMLGSLLGKADAAGFILTGGTEANMMALWIARNMKGVGNPEVIVPETAHFSFEKASDVLGLKLVKAKVKEHCVDAGDVASKVNENTVAIVGIAGSTEYGALDDIEALSKIALSNDVFLHVDAAFGGLVIPFLRELGYETGEFGFSLKGVSSITVDPHKMGLAPIPGGCLLLRDESHLNCIEKSSPYLTEKRHYTFSGTRTGASAAAVYAVLSRLGREGYRKNVEKCMNLTMALYKQLKKRGIVVIKPTMNILVFEVENPEELSKCLAEKGWNVSRTTKGEIRLVIMPHVSEESIAGFAGDLKKCMTSR